MNFKKVLLSLYIVFLAIYLGRFFSAQGGIHNAKIYEAVFITLIFMGINIIFLSFFYIIYKTGILTNDSDWIRFKKICILIFLVNSPLVVYAMTKLIFRDELLLDDPTNIYGYICLIYSSLLIFLVIPYLYVYIYRGETRKMK